MFNNIFVCLVSLLFINCGASKPKFIIDNDAGGDDAMAIFLALSYEKYFDGPELVALTTGHGNTYEDNVAINNQKILKVANRQDIPIYRGSTKSLIKTPKVDDYYGKDGLGDTGDNYTDLVPPKDQPAVFALIEYSKKYEGNLTVITIGALTNVAMAISIDPGFLGRLNQLYIGAGHIHSRENPDPEFNASVDVEAYHIVTENATPNKVTIFPFSQVKEYLNFTKEWRLNVLGAIPTTIMAKINRYEKYSIDFEPSWQALDPAVIALYLKPELVEIYRYSKNHIILCDEERGIVTNNFVDKQSSNVRIAYAVKKEQYGEFLLNVFKYETTIKRIANNMPVL